MNIINMIFYLWYFIYDILFMIIYNLYYEINDKLDIKLIKKYDLIYINYKYIKNIIMLIGSYNI